MRHLVTCLVVRRCRQRNAFVLWNISHLFFQNLIQVPTSQAMRIPSANLSNQDLILEWSKDNHSKLNYDFPYVSFRSCSSLTLLWKQHTYHWHSPAPFHAQSIPPRQKANHTCTRIIQSFESLCWRTWCWCCLRLPGLLSCQSLLAWSGPGRQSWSVDILEMCDIFEVEH